MIPQVQTHISVLGTIYTFVRKAALDACKDSEVLAQLAARKGEVRIVVLPVGDDGQPEEVIPHRLDGPAIDYPDRQGGRSGADEWMRWGVHHREDGPAYYEPETSWRWLRNGVLHRDDGPAVEFHPRFNMPAEYWVDGERSD